MDARKRWVLDALEIDLWITPQVGAVAPAGGTSPAAAARALLSNAGGTSARGAPAVVEPDVRASSTPAAAALSTPPVARAGVLPLWCLSGPAGALLAPAAGLDAQGRRLLLDVYQAQARLTGLQTRPQQQTVEAPPPELPLDRAIKGLLRRLLEGSEAPFLLLVGKAVLARSLVPGSARVLELPAVAELMTSGAAKRTLWRQMQAL